MSINKARRYISRLFRSGKDLAPEASEAFFHRLPNKISVSWFRDDGYIIGEVETDKYKFKTQGEDAEDFIFMVNDAVYTMYDIPENYRVLNLKDYSPPLKAQLALRNMSVNSSTLELLKVPA